jgi:hypothetical protein
MFKISKFSKEQIKGYEKLIPWFVEISKNRDFIKSFWLHGSRCVNQQKKYSDLDVAFIVSLKKDKDKLKKELKSKLFYKKLYNYFNNSIFEYWKFDDREVGVHIFTIREFNQLKKSFFNELDYFEKNQGLIQHIFIESKVLYDPLNKFTEARTLLSKYPETIREKVIKITLKRIKQESEWWAIRKSWKGVFEEIKILDLFIDEVTKCHYALNSVYRKNFLKQYSFVINKFKPDLKKELIELTYINPLKSNDTKKILIMEIEFLNTS